MPAFLGIPLWAWIAGGGALTLGGTYVAGEAAEKAGDAAEQTGDAAVKIGNSSVKLAVSAAALYAGYQFMKRRKK